MVENLKVSELQDIVASWTAKANLLKDQTRYETLSKLEEETSEVLEEIRSMNKEKLAMEIADVIFTCCLLAVQSNINLEEAIVKQLDKQYTRYNPNKAEVLVKEGKNGKEALKELKNEWSSEFNKKQAKIDKLANSE
jgi:phosphoribosyl-ATP pyrophosphohydrolase